MRIMGLDVGSKTVGVAISDELGWTAQGLKTLKINEEKKEFGFEEIGQLIKEYRYDYSCHRIAKKYERYDWTTW